MSDLETKLRELCRESRFDEDLMGVIREAAALGIAQGLAEREAEIVAWLREGTNKNVLACADAIAAGAGRKEGA